MHNKLVRNWVIFLIVLLFVISMQGKFVNMLFAIWVGAWVMGKLFNPFFGPHQGFEGLTWRHFVPYRYPVIAIWEMLENKKLAFFVLLWYSSGILAAFSIYQLLKILLIPA